MRARAAALAFWLVSGAVAAGAAKVDWGTYGFDVERTGENPSESILTPANVGGLAERWTTDVGAVIVASPVLAADVDVGGVAVDLLYVGTEHGDVVALDAATGAVVSSRTLGSPAPTRD